MAGCSDDLSWCCHSLFTRISTPPDSRKRGEEVFVYPGQPGAAIAAKGHAPCWLEGLEVLIGLEKGAHAEGIDEAEYEQSTQDVLDLS